MAVLLLCPQTQAMAALLLYPQTPAMAALQPSPQTPAMAALLLCPRRLLPHHRIKHIFGKGGTDQGRWTEALL